ncbi:hypothetical protein niasHS_010236 [Heterodera schachtii]|uniref:Uncharacterized protein n=1 Tax=Heterodera schachtii TaxID=97005 RepID=A0ABD2J1B9_HETSC
MALTNGVAEGEVELEVQKMDDGTGDGAEEEEATLVKKGIKLEEGEAEAEGGGEETAANESVEKEAAADDKTEDLVPDITNEDPMTTSMEGIDDIEQQQKEGEENEAPEKEEDSAAAEIPVDVYDEEAAEAPSAEEAEKAEEAEQPEADAAEAQDEEGAVEVPVENVGGEEVAEEEAPPAEEAAEAEPPAVEEEAPPAESETEAPEETPAETEGDEPKTEDEQQKFELQAPPRGRPRTPNELDEVQQVEVEVEQAEEVPEDVASVTGSRKAPSVVSPVAVSPVPTTPKSAASTKKTTFEDEVLSVKSGRSGRSIRTKSPRSPRTPRTPKSPKSPKKAVEVEDEGEAAKEEEEKQRQESFDARMREREEEESRWKRMTSWDKGEDGTDAERKVSAVAAETVDEVPEEKSEAEPAEKAEEEEKPAGEEEPKSEVEVEEAPAVSDAEAVPEARAEEQPEAAGDEEIEAPPGPPRPERSPSPIQRREPVSRDYMPYDQDIVREAQPARLPTATSFSSYSPAERETYKPHSPWVDQSSKYRNEYTVGEPPVAPAAYTAFFDDMVATGPFASSLYSTSRLLERSRSRTRERRQALRSQSQARNYFRFASQYPAPLRTRDYSTPPSSYITRTPTAASSFVSFIDNYGAKQYDLARSQSLHRSSVYNSNLALSRSASRGGIDYYLGSGRMSRVDSYADALHSRYEWNVPSSHELYYASNRGQVGYKPLANYQSYVGGLQRSLSRERYERDRLRNKYATVSYQLDQAVKQMDLLRSHNYSSARSGSAPRTSVYAHFYPYY